MSSRVKIFQTNAVLYSSASNSGSAAFTEGGIIWQSETLLQQYSEFVSRSYQKSSSVAMWFDLNKELGLQLNHGTVYTYEMFAIIGGTFCSASYSCTLTAGKPGASQFYTDRTTFGVSESVAI